MPPMLAGIAWMMVALAALAAGVAAAGHAIAYKRDPRAAVAWVIVAFTLPFAGPILYLLFGINRLRRQARRWRRPRAELSGGGPMSSRTTADFSDLQAVGAEHLKELFNLGSRLTDAPMFLGNRAQPLHDGEEAYPAMLEAIRAAERSVNLLTYIFDADEAGRQFVDALADAHRRGVAVRALVDGMGERYSPVPISRWLAEAGLRWAHFLPVRAPWPGAYINLRNHRKILVVDGKLAFTGGMNISSRHYARRPAVPRRVTDLHFRIGGPVVAALQETFLDDWFFVTGEMLGGQRFFPELEPDGPALARPVVDGPDESLGRFQWMVLGGLACAKKRVCIMTPYLIPDRALVAALGTAALRGVSVTIVLPLHADHEFVAWASRAYLWELLERGVRVFFRPPPFAHTKLFLVDRMWLLLGSANLDPRSFRLNFELNLEIYDPHLAGELGRFFDDTVAGCEEATLEQMDARPVHIRLRDGFAKLFSPYL